MIRRVGGECKISSGAEDIETAEALLLPGVGSFDEAVKNLRERGYFALLQEKALVDRIPILGVCLGMQLMTKGSEEGDSPGLGLVNAEARRIRPGPDKALKVPHMGWNSLSVRKPSQLFSADEEQRFYFVHSYAVSCANQEDVLATTRYGSEFVSAFEHENIVGLQFHPEKSHRYGMNFFSKYLGMIS
jgi:glutamine amidotransferase